jgi:putative ABC transport system permease protein
LLCEALRNLLIIRSRQNREVIIKKLNSMFRNYIKIAFRNLWKDKVYALLNIVGLALSMAVCLMIFLNVDIETSYDRFHEDADQLYRVTTVNYKNGVATYHDAMSFNAVGPRLTEDLPEVTGFARTLKQFQGVTFRVGREVYTERGAMLADPSFLDLFHYPLVAGDKGSVLGQPYTMVLTRSAARQYFGEEAPVGKTIEVPGGRFQGLWEVTGVIDDVPANTHLKFDVLLSYNTLWSIGEELNWNNFNNYTFVKLREDADVAALNDRMPALAKQYGGENFPLAFYLQPVVDIHLHSNLAYEAEVNGSGRTVYFLSLIGIFILIIAWINYINLSTARAVNRAKEVGIRKTVGAGRGTLIRQFMTEAALVNLIACLLAVLVVQQALPWFNRSFDQALTIPTFPDDRSLLNFWLLLGLFFLFGTFASGLYPAFVLSGYRPVNVLKGKLRDSLQGLALRKGLVVSQFAISTALIIGVFVVQRQLRFMTNQEMGMDLEQVMAIKNPNVNSEDEAEHERFQTFKREAERLPGVELVSKSTTVPAGAPSDIGSASGGIWREGQITEERLTYYVANVDYDFFDAYGIQFLAGRGFSREMRTDTGRVMVLNESALQQLGFDDAEQAVGSNLVMTQPEGQVKYRILGVIRNFSRQSLKNAIEPTIYFNISEGPALYYSIELDAQNLSSTIVQLEALWERSFSDRSFDYFFADEQFNALYQADRQFSRLFHLFALLAIGIACMGVYGLSAFTLYQRTKEIGIRKVLGASVSNILMLFLKDFFRLVILGFLIATPLIYLVMDNWLEGYAFRIDIPWWVFPVGMIATLLIVLGTISVQTFRAATANPVEALRDE